MDGVGEVTKAVGEASGVDLVPVAAYVRPLGAGIGRAEPARVERAHLDSQVGCYCDVGEEDRLVDAVIFVRPPVVSLDWEA
jgi:hypothetical protein